LDRSGLLSDHSCEFFRYIPDLRQNGIAQFGIFTGVGDD
jgi:hypothetical protein